MKLLSLVLLLALLSGCSNQPASTTNSAQSTDNSDVTIVSNATIYTMDGDNPKTEAMAFRDDEIIDIGSTQQLLDKYSGAANIDTNGATVIPGFIDAHGHLLGLGQSLIYVDLVGTLSKQEIIDRLKQGESKLSEGQWLLGRGWDQNDWPEKTLPSAQDLDQAFPDRPVWLERIDGHASWGNSQAMAVAEVSLSGEWQVDGGEIVRDENKNATGVFIDKAAEIVQSKVPTTSDAEIENALELAMAKTASVGLTSMHDAGTSLRVWQILEKLNLAKQLNIRVYAMADGSQDMLDHLCENGSSIDPEAMLTARAIKLYSDGALGSRGAAMIEEYSDDPGNFGLLIETEETLKEYADRAARCGLQVNIHAIGDRGNRVTLNVLESIAKHQTDARNRIEHSQVIAKQDFDRFKQLGLIASVQPTHATSDMYWAEDRVGDERILGAYAWQEFKALGIPLALGSDFPVELPDPLIGFYAAITRQDAKGWPEGGWYPNQTLSREDALYGFTMGAAYAAFQEDTIGSLKIGKKADFVILSKDIMTIPSTEILDTKIVATYLNGKAIFKH